MADRPQRIPTTTAKAEPEGSPEPTPELVSEAEDTAAGGAQIADATSALSSQIAGLEGLITRLVSTVEVHVSALNLETSYRIHIATAVSGQEREVILGLKIKVKRLTAFLL